MTTKLSDSMINLVINKKYKITEQIGKGAFGKVYKVINIIDNEIFALKLIHKNDVAKEASKIHRLNYKYKIKFEEEFFVDLILKEFLNSSQNFKCIILEYCHEGDLRKKIDEKINTNTEFEFKTIYLWSKGLIFGLNFLHKNEIIHRDIKPENILLKNNSIKIADFGVSLISVNNQSVYGETGTHDYKSPEMCAGKKYNSKTDIWSAGCIIFELITLQSFNRYLNLHNNKIIDRDVPEQLQALIKKMLVRDYNFRADSFELKKYLISVKNASLIANQKLTSWSIDFDKLPTSKLNEESNEKKLKREKILEEFRNIFSMKRILVVYSSPGNGKSTIVNQYGHEFKKKPNSFVYSFNASKSNLDIEFKSFTQNVLNKSNYNDIEIKDLFDWLCNNLNENTRILFIFENCETNQYIQNIIKCSLSVNLKNIFILITTRNNNLLKDLSQDIYVNYELNPFNRNECLEYLKLNFSNEKEAVLNEFLNVISDESNEITPYVINKISAFIKLNNQINLSRAIQLFKNDSVFKNEIKLFNEKILLEILVKSNLAWNILKYSAFLDYEFVPIKIYLKLIKIENKDLLEPINFLKSLSLITCVQKAEIGLKIHSCLKREIKDYLNSSQKEISELKENFVNLLEYIYSEDKDSWSKNKLYRNNVICITELILSHLDSSRENLKMTTRYNFANFYSFWGKHNEALELYEMCLNSKEYPINISTSMIYTKIGKVYNYFGKYDLALKNYNKALQNNISNFSEIYADIALIYYKKSDYERALYYYKNSIDLINDDKYNLSAANSLNIMGIIYNDMENYELALESFNKSLEIYAHNSNGFNPDVLSNIASIFYSQRKYELALDYYEKSRKVFKKIYGENINTANCIQSIGNIFFDQQKFDLALESFEKSLDMKKKLFNNNHSEISLLLNKIGEIHFKIRQFDKSLEFFHKALEINKIIEYENISTAEILTNIGNLHRELNDYELANVYHKDSVKILNNILNNKRGFKYPLNKKKYNLAAEYLMNSENFINEYSKKIDKSLIGESLKLKQTETLDTPNNLETEKLIENGNEKYEVKVKVSNVRRHHFKNEKYNLLEHIGKGRFGSVYRIIDKKNQIFALKIIPLDSWSAFIKFEEKSILESFKGKSNDYLVGIIDLFIENSFQYIVLEYCTEGDLRNKISIKKDDNSNYDNDDIFRWSSQILKGLDFLHNQQHIIHRDIKPENILVHEHNAKIADFGISTKMGESSLRSTQVGTLNYWSPEIDNNSAYDYKTDIWSTGCVIFELITLISFKQLLKSDSNEIFENVPAKLIYLIKKMLVKNPEKRATSNSLCNELKELNNSEYETLSMKYWTQPFKQIFRNYSFEESSSYYERKIKIKDIEDAFFKTNKQIVMIKSTEMTGKTHLVKEFAKSFTTDSNHAFFIDCNSIKKEFEKIYSLLRFVPIKNIDLDGIYRHIKNCDINSKVLFIFDDLNYDLNGVLNDLPKSNVYILITTRKLALNIKNSFSIYLDQFDDLESLKFLELKLKLKLSNDEDKEFQVERIQNYIKLFRTDRLLHLLKLASYFENNELDCFDDILDNFENDFKNNSYF